LARGLLLERNFTASAATIRGRVAACYRRRVVDRLSIAALALLLTVLGASSAAAQSWNLGRLVYIQNCAPCHGEIESPGGPVAPERGAVPAYYAGSNYLMAVPPRTIRVAVLYGVTGTGMNGMGGQLSDVEIESLIGYIESFRR
jgi:mono/diheme cytochrome c family protein